MNESIKRRVTIGIWTVFISLLFSGCTGVKTPSLEKEQVPLVAITDTPTGKHNSGRFVWHDLITDDASEARKFYAALFGWSFEDQGRYTVISNHDKPIGGILEIAPKPGTEAEAIWLPSMSVANVDNSIAYLKSKKGEVLKGPVDMKERGRGAIVSDPHGAQLVLLNAKGGDPTEAVPKIGDWLWNELWTHTPKESYAFYRKLGKYDASELREDYRILKSKDKWRAGIRHLAKADVKARWASVIRVSDPKAITERVPKLGGKVLMEPDETFMNGDVAVIADNTGALLIIQRWDETLAEEVK